MVQTKREGNYVPDDGTLLIEAARALRSDGSNSEYDRALIELCADALPMAETDRGDFDIKRERIRAAILDD